jgi:hypothetical protein
MVRPAAAATGWSRFEKAISFAFLAVAVSLPGAPPCFGESRMMLRPISTAEFMSFSDNAQVIYVAGILEGMSLMTYKPTAAYRKWTECVRSKTLGETTKEVVALIKQNPNYQDSIAAAVSQSLGKRCKP